MKTEILLLLFTILSLSLFSQKTLVDFSISSGIRDFELSSIRPTSFLDSRSSINQSSYVSINLGIRIAQRNRYSIHLESSYSRDKYRSTIAGLRFPTDITATPMTETEIANTAYLNIFSLGVNGRYNVAENIHKKVLFELGTGSSFPLYTTGDAIIFYGNNTEEEISDSSPQIAKASFFGTLGVYIKYPLSPKIKIFINPTMRHYFIGIGETFINSYRINLTSYELRVGISKFF